MKITFNEIFGILERNVSSLPTNEKIFLSTIMQQTWLAILDKCGKDNDEIKNKRFEIRIENFKEILEEELPGIHKKLKITGIPAAFSEDEKIKEAQNKLVYLIVNKLGSEKEKVEFGI